MTDKEKIKKEIESLYKEWGWYNSIEGHYRYEVYKELLEFIDSLPEEPVSKDLEEAAIEYATSENPPDGITHELIKWNFKAGAQWQKEQMINKACKWLLNNIKYYSTNALGAECMCNDFREAMEAEK